MKSLKSLAGVLCITACCSNNVLAAELSVSTSASDNSQYTLQDVCHRLNIAKSVCTNNTIMAKLSPQPQSNQTIIPFVVVKNKWNFMDWFIGAAQAADSSQTLSADNDTMASGIYTATTLSAVDSDLASGNIKSGVTIFGIAGDSNVVDTSAGGANATANDIESGRKVWVNGVEITGTASCI
jgi:hypothetical protein